MWMLSLSTPEKIGVVFWGFLAGVAGVVATAFAGLMIAILIMLLSQAGYFSLGEMSGWILIAGLGYGLYLGIIVGLIVWIRFCWKRLRPVPQSRVDDPAQ